MNGKAIYRLDDLTIDVGRGRVGRGQDEIPLPKLSFDLLLALVRAAPNLLSLDELMSQVWPGVVVSPETVTQRVKALRDALGDDAKAPRYIVGLRGRGYQIAPPVERIQANDSSAASAIPPVTVDPPALAPRRGRLISFDGWVLDRESGDLTRDGTLQRLQELPLKVLDLLIANPGSVVTREQLIAHLWPTGVVDFDTGLNTAVRKLRLALGDVADTPRYIETLPRRGYRFLGVLAADPEVSDPRAVEPVAVQSAPEKTLATTPSPPRDAPHRRGLFITVAVGLALVGIISYWIFHRLSVATQPIAATVPAKLAPLPDHTVAVLPFENLSAAPENEFLALGISEMVMHRLAATRHLMVIARTSSFVFKNRDEDARVIGRKLNARYLVAGSVQREGERLRVTAELVDASSGAHVWSLNFDRKLDDIFALQDEISNKVADALSVSLTYEAGSAPVERTSNLDAYLAYMQGLALISTYKVADAEAAVERFARAIEIDPQFAAAYVQQGRAIDQVLRMSERSDPVAQARAVALNDKALALDPSLGEAWVQRAMVHKDSGSNDVAAIEQEYRKGLALAPNYGQGFAEFSNFLFDLGRTDEALAMVDRARQVDPLAPRNHYLKGLYLWELGNDTSQVAALYLQALRINPNYHAALARLGQLRIARGSFAEGMKMMERAIAIDPQAKWLRESMVRTYLNMGDLAAALDVLNGEKERPARGDVCVLLYQRQTRAAAASAQAFLASSFSELRLSSQRCAAASIRDDALATRRYDPALRTLEAQYGVHVGSLDEDTRIASTWGLPYAQVLWAKGEKARATQLTRAVLASIERVIDRPESLPDALYWRAVALAILGDSGGAVTSLESAVRKGMVWNWWMIDREPAFTGLKQDMRYKAIIAQLTDMARRQAALAAEMRKTHELPQRPRPS